MALLFLIPGVIWFILAIASFAEAGGECNSGIQPVVMIIQGIFYLLGAGFLLYSMGRIGAAYNKAENDNIKLEAQGKKPKKGMTMTKQVFNFIGYDWIFLGYSIVFCCSMIYDVICLSVGASGMGDPCLAAIGNLLSALIHFALRILLCFMGCCIVFQVQCSENPICTPIMSCITCGMINPEKRRALRRRRQEVREKRENGNAGWMDNQG